MPLGRYGPAWPGTLASHVAVTKQLLLPKSDRKHQAALGYWQQFCTRYAISGASASSPSVDLQAAYLGYLAQLPQLSGDTAASYLSVLPVALRNRLGKWTSPMVLHPSIRSACKVLKVRKPSGAPLKRDPLPLRVLSAIWKDPSIMVAVRAAVVIQYHLALRGCNVYRTGWSELFPDCLLQWSDVTPATGRNGAQVLVIRIRAEKNAVTAVGSFQPELLVPSEWPEELPCPVAAFAAVGLGEAKTGPVFPLVTSKRVQYALDKHQLPGLRFTPHSLRSGAASDYVAAGGDDLGARQKGRWRSQAGLDRYAQQTEDRKRRELGRLVQVERQMHAGAGAAAPAPAAAAELVPAAAEPARYHPMHTAILYWPTQPHEEKCLVLVCHPRADKYWAYAYSPDGQRAFLVHGPGKAKLQYVPLSRSELDKVVQHNPPMDARDSRHVEFLPSDCPLLKDAQFVRDMADAARQAGKREYTRLNGPTVPNGPRAKEW